MLAPYAGRIEATPLGFEEGMMSEAADPGTASRPAARSASASSSVLAARGFTMPIHWLPAACGTPKSHRRGMSVIRVRRLMSSCSTYSSLMPWRVCAEMSAR